MSLGVSRSAAGSGAIGAGGGVCSRAVMSSSDATDGSRDANDTGVDALHGTDALARAIETLFGGRPRLRGWPL